MINGFQYSCSNTAGVGVREKWWRMEKCFVCGVNGINSRRRNYGKFYKWLLNSSMGFASLLVIVIVTNEGLVLEVNIIFWGSVDRNNWVTNYQNYSNIFLRDKNFRKTFQKFIESTWVVHIQIYTRTHTFPNVSQCPRMRLDNFPRCLIYLLIDRQWEGRNFFQLVNYNLKITVNDNCLVIASIPGIFWFFSIAAASGRWRRPCGIPGLMSCAPWCPICINGMWLRCVGGAL